MEVGFCVSAMEEALRHHDAPSISNTDQGSQFTSEAFVRPLLVDGSGTRPKHDFLDHRGPLWAVG